MRSQVFKGYQVHLWTGKLMFLFVVLVVQKETLGRVDRIFSIKGNRFEVSSWKLGKVMNREAFRIVFYS